MMNVRDSVDWRIPGGSLTKGGLSFEGGLDAAGLRIAVIVARFNAHVTSKLYDGCRDEFGARGLDLETLESVEVPGCFELPLVAKTMAASGRYDAVVCLGAVIRGDTPHFDYVSSETASGLQRAALDTGVPVDLRRVDDGQRRAGDRARRRQRGPQGPGRGADGDRDGAHDAARPGRVIATAPGERYDVRPAPGQPGLREWRRAHGSESRRRTTPRPDRG